jgi:NAD dependent epimerase/dehydratase family enzyme
MKTILIAGGSGLIGSALSAELSALGYEVIILSRSAGPGKITWDPSAGKIDIDQPLQVEAIVNLAGSNLSDGRWTKKRKEDIVSSRVQSAETLRSYLQQGLLQTNVYIGASGIGFYRNSGDQEVNENTPTSFPDDWMVQTVIQWEAGHQSIRSLTSEPLSFDLELF